MTIQQFIEKVIEGGFDDAVNLRAAAREYRRSGKPMHADLSERTIFLNPKAWKAVGKVEGWSLMYAEWRKKWHRMIDALAEGKTIEEYLETL